MRQSSGSSVWPEMPEDSDIEQCRPYWEMRPAVPWLRVSLEGVVIGVSALLAGPLSGRVVG